MAEKPAGYMDGICHLHYRKPVTRLQVLLMRITGLNTPLRKACSPDRRLTYIAFISLEESAHTNYLLRGCALRHWEERLH